MRILLVEAGIITLYIFAHLHTDIIIYSVMALHHLPMIMLHI